MHAVLAEVGTRSPHRGGDPSSGSMGTSEYIYDQCGYNPQATTAAHGSHSQAELLRRASTSKAAATEATASRDAGGTPPRITLLPDINITRASPPRSRFGPLGSEQQWCGARQAAQPVWNSLPAVAKAMHMKPFTGNSLNYATSRTGPGSDLRPL